MDDEGQIKFRDSLELWLIRDSLVASQRSYSYPYMRDSWRENRYFYCPTCGEVWGKRLDAQATAPRHNYISKPCKEHGGDEAMTYPWEEKNSWVHGAGVLAHLVLLYTTAQEANHDH